MKRYDFNSLLFAHANFCMQLDNNSAQCQILNKNSVYYTSICRVKHFLDIFCYDPTKRETYVRRQVSMSLLRHSPPPNGCSASTGLELEQKFWGYKKTDPVCSLRIPKMFGHYLYTSSCFLSARQRLKPADVPTLSNRTALGSSILI